MKKLKIRIGYGSIIYCVRLFFVIKKLVNTKESFQEVVAHQLVHCHKSECLKYYKIKDF